MEKDGIINLINVVEIAHLILIDQCKKHKVASPKEYTKLSTFEQYKKYKIAYLILNIMQENDNLENDNIYDLYKLKTKTENTILSKFESIEIFIYIAVIKRLCEI